jgi:hypothetical protein
VELGLVASYEVVEFEQSLGVQVPLLRGFLNLVILALKHAYELRDQSDVVLVSVVEVIADRHSRSGNVQ